MAALALCLVLLAASGNAPASARQLQRVCDVPIRGCAGCDASGKRCVACTANFALNSTANSCGCPAGWSDCDRDAANGCEVNLSSPALNCGCRTCAPEQSCQPITLSDGSPGTQCVDPIAASASLAFNLDVATACAPEAQAPRPDALAASCTWLQRWPPLGRRRFVYTLNITAAMFEALGMNSAGACVKVSTCGGLFGAPYEGFAAEETRLAWQGPDGPTCGRTCPPPTGAAPGTVSKQQDIVVPWSGRPFELVWLGAGDAVCRPGRIARVSASPWCTPDDPL